MAEAPIPETQDTTKPTVREQLVEAAERLARKVAERDPFLFAIEGAEVLSLVIHIRAEPECSLKDCGFDCPCYKEGANEGHSQGCNDDSCACWAAGYQAGTEAQREPAGRGTV